MTSADNTPTPNSERGTRNLSWPLRGGVFLLLLMTGWAAGNLLRGTHHNDWPPRNGRVRVLTTIFPLYDFVREVGGPYVEVRNLLPPGVDPHEFALSPRDVSLVAGADVLIANGSGLDDFLTDALAKANKAHKEAVDCSAGLPKRQASEGHKHDAQEASGDPHLWLNPRFVQHYVQVIAEAIARELTARGSADQAAGVLRRAATYKDQLAELDGEYEARLAVAPSRTFIAFHSAYGYLAERYDLEMAAVWQTSPGREPSPREVEAILRIVRSKHVRALFSEPQFSPRAIEMVAADAHLPVYTLDPLETAEDFSKSGYLVTMRRNLDTLVKALSGKDGFE